jgi:hypothetical protein
MINVEQGTQKLLIDSLSAVLERVKSGGFSRLKLNTQTGSLTGRQNIEFVMEGANGEEVTLDIWGPRKNKL